MLYRRRKQRDIFHCVYCIKMARTASLAGLVAKPEQRAATRTEETENS